MPRSEESSRTFARTACSCARPMRTKTGVVSVELGAGLAVCAARQIVQVAFSLWPGWTWVDSAATVHNNRDRQSHADQRIHNRITFPNLDG